MEELLMVNLNMTQEDCHSFMEPFEGNKLAIIDDILGWTENTMKVNSIEWGAFVYTRTAFERYRYIVLLELSGWVDLYKNQEKFLTEASLFELKVTFNQNPLYPFLAFGVPFEACEKLAVLNSININPKAYAYAVAFSMIRTRRRITQAELDAAFDQLGVDKKIDVTAVYSCGTRILTDHELGNLDITLVPPAQLGNYVANKWEIVVKVREKTAGMNQLFRCANGDITWKSDSIQFMRLIRYLNRPITI